MNKSLGLKKMKTRSSFPKSYFIQFIQLPYSQYVEWKCNYILSIISWPYKEISFILFLLLRFLHSTWNPLQNHITPLEFYFWPTQREFTRPSPGVLFFYPGVLLIWQHMAHNWDINKFLLDILYTFNAL